MTRITPTLSLGLFLCACAGNGASDVEPRNGADTRIAEHIVHVFSAHDSDSNGTLSRSEASRHPMLSHGFDLADADANGQLTQEEVTETARDLHEEHCAGEECGDHGSPDEHVAQLFAQLDVDRDGALSQAEVEGHQLAHFVEQADADGNGRVTQDELVAFAGRMHGADHEPRAHR